MSTASKPLGPAALESRAATFSIVAEVTSMGGVRKLGVVFEGGRPDVGRFAEGQVLRAKDVDDGAAGLCAAVCGSEDSATFPVGDGSDGLADAAGENFWCCRPLQNSLRWEVSDYRYALGRSR
jgi:hypothetical protein